ETTICKVVDKFIHELEEKLLDKDVTLHVDEAARTWFVKNGYDHKMGARPMARLIQEELKKPLADELLFGSLHAGGHIDVTVKNNKLNLNICEKVQDKT
ncbi:MAG TPA: ATP-dependent Clp protease ATP-binding subunit ClpA, partial [Gammaproteobacteria bacterium]|nr:ATP-dependent Clp protease ATP-binding subunit ClpA [Gammaproteobacteria bacterium]